MDDVTDAAIEYVLNNSNGKFEHVNFNRIYGHPGEWSMELRVANCVEWKLLRKHMVTLLQDKAETTKDPHKLSRLNGLVDHYKKFSIIAQHVEEQEGERHEHASESQLYENSENNE
ncbi:hypothetical protein QQS21_000769 [Conoideocrella luteorostrata]|uniref:Uncharacterized protein n=1 Tax=Conoideocrella luteorostrata TaxID=1105319 RepID=A0AAJ0D0Y1_9HYPO|nr:hypothetical protein QQS21_000769 [Conoideocrella luteorostrata]